MSIETIFQLQKSKAKDDYRGSGKAWAAIKNDEVVALRYMGNFALNPEEAEPWVCAAYKAYRGLLDDWPASKISGTYLGRIKSAAISAGHPMLGPQGGHIKASSIARAASQILCALEREQFGRYRSKCRDELSKMGTVHSGMCSCWEFYANTN